MVGRGVAEDWFIMSNHVSVNIVKCGLNGGALESTNTSVRHDHRAEEYRSVLCGHDTGDDLFQNTPILG